MNSLLIDFIVEARELLESVGTNLLELEEDPGNEDLLNLSFRAFHTLKGDSGLFDFRPITEVLHAAEDQLGALREGRLALTHDLVDTLLAAGDQIGSWLIDIERTEGLPDDAPATAERLAQRLEALSGATVATALEPSAMMSSKADLECFSADVRRRATVLAMRAGDVATFIRFRPDAECFFRGEDPLFTVQQIEPRFVQIEGPAEWPPLSEIDPYQCALGFTVLTTLSREEVEYRFRYVMDQVEIVDLWLRDLWVSPESSEELDSLELSPDEMVRVAVWAERGDVSLLDVPSSDRTTELLREQIVSLGTPGDPAVLEGRLRSTATVICRILGLNDADQVSVEAKVTAGIEQGSTEPLISWIRDRLAGPQASMTERTKTTGANNESQSTIKTLKVDQARIDKIMSLIGEMVVAKNSLPYLSDRAERTYGVRALSREIKDQYAIINRITQEMQDAIMEVRMLPVSHVLQRFPRLVRDLSRKLGKKIEMVTDGEDTEADKTVIEALGDPLLHIIRNSIDHGIEPPDERTRLGKPTAGTIRVKASQDNGQVLIVISDDGRGIDPQRIKDKALAQGILDAERYDTLSDREAIQLIFHAGFSTAEAITDVSGRGVGMDVVRSGVEHVGGTVQVHSELGKGSSVEISLPMTMSTSQVMVIEIAGQLFGVPVQMVLETVRIPTKSIFHLKDREVVVLRDQTMPLVRLGRLLNMKQDQTELEETSVLVVKHFGECVGVVVDDFHTNVEVILRPIEGILAGLKGFSSSALLGNGAVLLILDLQELF